MRIHALPRIPLLALAVAFVAVLALWWPAAPADAHPLGNFTINHYTRIDVTGEGIELFRVLDLAEIPSAQELPRIDAGGDSWAAAKASELRQHMTLRFDGKELALSDVSHELKIGEGQAGLQVVRLEVRYRAALPAGWRDGDARIAFEDANYADRIGWREVVVRVGSGVELVASDVPAESVSAELTAFPTGLASPLDVRAALFAVQPGAGAPLPAISSDAARATRGNTDSTLTRFADLAGKDRLTPGVIAIALLAAVGFGAVHALSPGHGKTVVAAYLVGSRGTAKHALLLGLTVTITHTSTVYLLGGIALYLSEYIVPEKLYPWLGVSSGALIVLLGTSLFYGRLRASGLGSSAARWLRARLSIATRQTALAGEAGALSIAMPSARSTRSTHEHEHEHEHGAHGGHDDKRPHSHGIGPAHSHAIPGQDGEPVTWRSLIGLGIFGGMIPCPSAIVVMLSAIALHRVAFGLVLIVAFSVGLAGVLTAIGFALVYARALTARVPALQRIADRAGQSEGVLPMAVRVFPVAAAGAVITAGLIIALRAFAQF